MTAAWGEQILRLTEVGKTYRSGSLEVAALRGVSFTVDAGEYVAIMGPSGSGKSTLMHILGCLDVPTAGVYELAGQDVGGLSEAELAEIRNARIGFVFQQFNLLPRITAQANVEMPLLYGDVSSRERRERAQRKLEVVGLQSRTGHRPAQLSGGEQQRVAIARALVNDPILLLADEPTGNLDTRTSDEIMAAVQALHRTGLSIVLVTHEPDIAQYAQRILSFRDGMLVGDEAVRDRRQARAA